MLRNYFKIAFRNLWRSRGFSFINILGLAVGMASAMLIVLWIVNEATYDNFHENRDRIYEAWNRAAFSGEMHAWNTTPKILARTTEHDLPEVERAVRVNWSNYFLFSVGEKRINVRGNIVDTGFLQMFSFPLIKGDPKTALNDRTSIVVTQKLAKKLFGTEEVMGKLIKVDNEDVFRITGIAKDLPINTRFDFEYLMPWSYLIYKNWDDSSWGNNSTRTYVLLQPNATLASVAPKIRVLKARYDKEDPKWEMFFYPMSRWNLHSSFTNGIEDNGGKIVIIKLFAIIAAFILLIACINFMNLSTARSEKRAKEVGIRKVVGAQKASLISQFLGESVLIAFLAGILAVGIVALSLPAFNTLTNKELSLHLDNIYFWITGMGFILLTGIIAGSYPAFFLSGLRPVKVLKGTFKSVNKLVTPRKVLVVMQFTFAIVLIICTLIVKQQIDHAQKRESGYNKDHLLYIWINGDINKNFQLIKNELYSSGIATSISKTSQPMTQGWSDTWGFEWDGKDPNDKTDFDRFCADENIAKTAGFQFVAGRDFDLKSFPTDSTALILNESAVKAMHFKQPIGQIIKDDGVTWHVVGVIKDFILRSPFEPMRPMVIEGSKGFFNAIHIRLNPAVPTPQAIQTLEKITKKYNPEYPFVYDFIDKEYEQKFDDEKRTATLASLFAALTIFISCLGLFGLATYMAENRIREIGVRKVLGATVASITTLLSKDFLTLVLISFVIATPIAWLAMHAWLQSYTYRVTISWWVFVWAGMLSVLIALVTVSFQAIRAAIANPVKSLRTE